VNRLHLVRNSGAPRPLGTARFISVLSGKGGVGKTMLALNLAERICCLGHRVLLVDADFTAGNIHILTNVHCQGGVEEFVSGKLTLREATTPVNDQLDILAAPSQPVAGLSTVVDAANLLQRLHKQNAKYDYVLFDHASGISNIATAIAYGSDMSLLVLVPELTSISDAFGLFKFLNQAGDNLVCRFLLNRTDSEDEANSIRDQFRVLSERFLGKRAEFIGHLPETGLVRKSIASQQTIAAMDPESPIVGELTRLADRIVTRLGDREPDTQTKTINKTSASADIWG